MAKLTTSTRSAIPTKSFALPGRRYPIEDKNHAKAALSMGAKYASPSQYSTIKAKVKAKFGMGKSKTTKMVGLPKLRNI